MKRAVLSISLIIAVFAFVLQLPIGDIAMRVGGQLAAVLSRADYGAKLGVTIDEVVKSLRYQDKKNGHRSYITHRHIMAMMCQENPKLNIRINNGQGFSRGNQEGLTQVIDKTARGLLYGKMAGGRCRYVARLENGVCADLRARVNNPRCSIELGACYLNDKLKQARGNPYLAFVGYNTGSIRKTGAVNGGSAFNRGYDALSRGKLCAKARANPQTWSAMYKKIAELTGGTFKTGDAEHIPISSMNWPKNASKWPTPRSIGKSWWNSPAGRTISKAFGGQPQPQPQQPPQQSQKQMSSPQGQASQGQAPSQQSGSLGGTQGTVENPTITSTDDNENRKSDDIEPTYGSIDGGTVTENAKASITCKEDGQNVKISWSCPSSTTVSRGIATKGWHFNTHGAGAGVVKLPIMFGAEYTVQCISGHKIVSTDNCSVQSYTDDTIGSGVLKNNIPIGVVMHIEYNKGNVIWSTLGTDSCTIKAGNKTASGDAGVLYIGKPQKNTLIKLECDTINGKAIKYRRLIVR